MAPSCYYNMVCLRLYLFGTSTTLKLLPTQLQVHGLIHITFGEGAAHLPRISVRQSRANRTYPAEDFVKRTFGAEVWGKVLENAGVSGPAREAWVPSCPYQDKQIYE